MPTLIVNALEKRLPSLVNPDIARDFIYVDDVVKAYPVGRDRGARRSGRGL